MQLPKEDTEMVFKFWFIFFLISFPGQFFSLLLDTKKKNILILFFLSKPNST